MINKLQRTDPSKTPPLASCAIWPTLIDAEELLKSERKVFETFRVGAELTEMVLVPVGTINQFDLATEYLFPSRDEDNSESPTTLICGQSIGILPLRRKYCHRWEVGVVTSLQTS